jgi:endoglucanase
MLKRWLNRVGAALLAVSAACTAHAVSGADTTAPSTTRASTAAHAMAARLAPGVNFGNMLDAPREGDWGLRVEDDFYAPVGTGTPIRSVRLPVRWSNHASPDASAKIDPEFMTRVVQVVDRLLGRGVVVILNVHHYRQLDGDALDSNETPVASDAVEPRFIALWAQISARFARHDSRLLFEPYNEPHGRLNDRWNALLADAVTVIRRDNPDRLLVVGPTHWNAAHALTSLRLPNDTNIILTVHHYEPFDFTHQGADWVKPVRPTGLGCCNADQMRRMSAPLDQAVAYAATRGYPVFVGEFGAYQMAALPDRIAYFQTLRSLTAERKLPWIVWELASGFGFFDPVQRQLRSEIYAALFR